MNEKMSIKVLASDKLKQYVCEQCKDKDDAPENIKAFFNQEERIRRRGGKAALSTTADASPSILTVQDLAWLKSNLQHSSDDGNTLPRQFLHKLLEECSIILPEPPVTERNPELEARVQRLKKEQEEREYRAMTKNVDNTRMFEPDETLSSQMKMLNSHLIAVFQFVVSVGAGFTFGFLGVELIVGSLDFGFRLLLGIACALIIALAEIYFLAKKLSEDYDDSPPLQSHSPRQTPTVIKSGKQHAD